MSPAKRPCADRPVFVRAGVLPVVALIVSTLAAGCGAAASRPAPGAVAPELPARAGDDPVHVTLLQLNDVYEITPTGDGRRGGLARVATLFGDLRRRNPSTYAILAGDLMSPSALGTARVDGERLQGRQMVAVLNAVGLDFATFGNHEFDLGEEPFRSRLRESSFRWISANVSAAEGSDPLPNVVPHVILRVPGGGADTLRLALFGVTMDRDRADHVRIGEPLAAGASQAAMLRDSADAVVAVTHLPQSDDIALADMADIDLIAGGHEHENWLLRRGPGFTPIAKADANALSVWVHELTWDPRTGAVSVSSRLVAITDSIAEDPGTARVAREWVERAYAGFRESGFEPAHVIARVTHPLDGLESHVLVAPTILTGEIANAMLEEVGDAQAAIYNAGSIRIDDVLPPGPVSEYDVIRILPFGGPIVEVELSGALLRRILDQGDENRGTGGFLHTAGIDRVPDAGWRIAEQPIEDDVSYRVAISDFLLSGREQGLVWLTRDAAGVRVVAEHRDVRAALIDHLERVYPQASRPADLPATVNDRAT